MLGKWGSWFIQSKGVPGYPEVLAVNTGSGVLTKVGSIGGGSGVIVDGDVSCIEVEVYPRAYDEFATAENL